MEAVNAKKALENVKFHAKNFFRGFCRTVYGTAVSVLIAMAIYGFISVSKGTGWTAVLKFLVAFVLLIEGLWQIYLIGRNKKVNSGNREIRK